MAEGRMLKKHISTSEKVNNLSFEAMLLYTWAIPHTDDLGLIPASPRKLKAIVAPMWDMSLETFGIQLETIVKAGLFELYEVESGCFYYVVGHKTEQSLKKDRKPRSIALELSDWNQVESIWIQLENQVKGREGKLSKDKLNETTAFAVAPKREYGDPSINEVLEYLKTTLQLPTLDKSVKTNRQYAQLLIKESKRGVEGVRWLIDQVSTDDWWRNHTTSMSDLWNNRVKILASRRTNGNKFAGSI